ncbi:MAG: 4-(cytidine 5'-diphospho)-2-C-methyl-D-erythritol kinase [Proteobacteria bacterium]|nr:4-(cytidine 5'-diphospho)-2-C-methyl-D-erythritol kinase [Pseudomonadota bacterium]
MSDSPASTAVISAPAKINLYFNVIGKRPDGYHLIDSLIGFTALGDVLTIRGDAPLDIDCDGPFAGGMPPADQNLVYRAAQRLADAAGVPARGHISITKNLPVAAGIGGGSSDAAAALKALSALWGIPDGAVNLSEIGLTLGADLPACLRARTTYAGGIGELLEDAPELPPAGILLVNPGIGIAPPSVFAARKGGFSTPNRLQRPPADIGDLAAMLDERGNDLTDAAIRLCPVIRTVLTALEETPGCLLARMSGSGGTCFALYQDVAAAQRAADTIDQDGWWIAPSELAGTA